MTDHIDPDMQLQHAVLHAIEVVHELLTAELAGEVEDAPGFTLGTAGAYVTHALEYTDSVLERAHLQRVRDQIAHAEAQLRKALRGLTEIEARHDW